MNRIVISEDLGWNKGRPIDCEYDEVDFDDDDKDVWDRPFFGYAKAQVVIRKAVVDGRDMAFALDHNQRRQLEEEIERQIWGRI